MSRASVVGMLLAVEVLIVGAAVYAIGGSHGAFAADLHSANFTAARIAPVAAGAAPHVAIDDAASRVSVGVSRDGLVHVTDLTKIDGVLFSRNAYPQLQVVRSADGIRIRRTEAGDSFELFGSDRRAIDVDVPAGARLDIERCAGADVAGVAGGVTVHSLDGHVTLSDLGGSVTAQSDDGSLSATRIHGPALTLRSEDGHLALHDVAVAALEAHTDDGSVKGDAIAIAGRGRNEISTGDGSIALGLSPGADLTIDASTGDGRIVVDGSSYDGDDSAQRTIRLGTGSAALKLATSDGSIHLKTNGVL